DPAAPQCLCILMEARVKYVCNRFGGCGAGMPQQGGRVTVHDVAVKAPDALPAQQRLARPLYADAIAVIVRAEPGRRSQLPRAAIPDGKGARAVGDRPAARAKAGQKLLTVHPRTVPIVWRERKDVRTAARA